MYLRVCYNLGIGWKSGRMRWNQHQGEVGRRLKVSQFGYPKHSYCGRLGLSDTTASMARLTASQDLCQLA